MPPEPAAIAPPPDLTEAAAREADARDLLAQFRDRFHIPAIAGRPSVYLTGNSLGCQPKAARAAVEQELDDWARLGVLGHHAGRDPWLPYHEQFRAPLARLAGASPHEVVAMNSLTVNLHLLMVSFYRPTPDRHRILIEDGAFPSDAYAAQTQAAFNGYDPTSAVVRAKPRDGEHAVRTEDVEALLAHEGESFALVLFGGVNYLTGQMFHVERITAAARTRGCVVGWDLAHALGNVPLQLHDWGADFAVWCSYKYLNGGPGAVAGAFVHDRHAGSALPRFGGWWGNDPATRFAMRPEFEPRPDADGWQLSNPPILSLAPLKASLAIFEEAGMGAIRAKSVALTGYMERLLEARVGGGARVLTPREPEQRGAQLSLLLSRGGVAVREALGRAGVIVDYREPGIIRAAPAPLYVSYHDVWRFVDVLTKVAG